MILNTPLSMNEAITQQLLNYKQCACHDSWVCCFSITLPHLQVNYLPCRNITTTNNSGSSSTAIFNTTVVTGIDTFYVRINNVIATGGWYIFSRVVVDRYHYPKTWFGALVPFSKEGLHHRAHSTLGGLSGWDIWAKPSALCWTSCWSTTSRLEHGSPPSGGWVERVCGSIYHQTAEGPGNQGPEPSKLHRKQQREAASGSGWRGRAPAGPQNSESGGMRSTGLDSGNKTPLPCIVPWVCHSTTKATLVID